MTNPQNHDGLTGRRATAFTLIEMLTVIAVLALLLAILMPSLSTAKKLTRMALCKNNLHQISGAFSDAAASARNGTYFPASGKWPGVPQNVMSDVRMYFCPEDAEGTTSKTTYELYTSFGNSEFPDHFIPFGPSVLCKIVQGTTYDDYFFDDGEVRDIDDIEFHVSKTSPQIATFISGTHRGYPGSYGGHDDEYMALYRNGSVVPGWEEFRNVPDNKTFTLGAGVTNYGINKNVSSYTVSTNAIVLIDYVCEVVDTDVLTTLSTSLTKSARHLGKTNVLFADSSVTTMHPSKLDPTIVPGAAKLWQP